MKNREQTVNIMIRDSTQMNRDPSRAMTHRGMLSMKPTSSMMITISASRGYRSAPTVRRPS